MVQFHRLCAVQRVFIVETCIRKKPYKKLSQQIQESFSQGFKSPKINNTLTDKLQTKGSLLEEK